MKLAASSVGALIFSVFVLSLSALAADRIEISRDRVTGQATLVLDKSVSTSLPLTATADARTLKGSAGQFLRTHANSFGISDVKASLKAISSSTDHLGISHVKYLQVISGIQVFGGEINVHLNQEGIPYAATGKFVPGTVLDLKPKISKRELRNIVLSEWASEHFGAAAVVGAPSLILFSLENLTGELRLSYRVNATQFSGETVQDSADFVIDALNGKVLKTISHAYDLSRQIYDCNTYPATCYMDVWRSQYQYYFGRSEPYGVRGSHPIPGIFYGSHDVDNLFEYFGQAHSYYQTKFGRDGGNGAGGIGTGRSGETPTAYTRGLVHLDGAWSNCPAGASFTYTGRVQACLGMVTPDILGHEYSHSIPYFTFRDQNNYPVGAVYEGETGALNEAWANLAGEALELQIGGVHNWIIGQSFLSGGVPVESVGGARLNMADPGSLMWAEGQPYPDRFYSENVYCGAADNSGVHYNSTIPNYAMYLAAEGGSFNGCTIAPIGMDAVERIWYRGWTELFTSTETFNGAYTKLLQACSELYGMEHPEYCTELEKAMQAVELDQPGLCSGIGAVAPACAIPEIVPGDVTSARPTEVTATRFSPNENVWSLGAAWQGVSEVDVYVTYNDPARTERTELIPINGGPIRVSLDENGNFASLLWTADQEGDFDIVVDANLDGQYDPEVDRSTSFEVRALSDGDGLCYQGERWDTSEDCFHQPSDCACPPVEGGGIVMCTNMLSEVEHRYRCIRMFQADGPEARRKPLSEFSGGVSRG